jgi:hypothetical protein
MWEKHTQNKIINDVKDILGVNSQPSDFAITPNRWIKMEITASGISFNAI